MSDESEPLAIIKVTFDDIPDEFKEKLYIFLGASLALIIMLNIVLGGYILDNLYNKVKYLIDKDRNYYQPV